MMETLQDWFNTLVALATGAFGSFLLLRRRFSRDNAGIAHDKAEANIISALIAERDLAQSNAREAWEQRTADAMRIARFEALMEAGERETKRLREELFAMRLHTRKLTAIIVRLDPQAAHLLGVDDGSDGIPKEFVPSRPAPL